MFGSKGYVQIRSADGEPLPRKQNISSARLILLAVSSMALVLLLLLSRRKSSMAEDASLLTRPSSAPSNQVVEPVTWTNGVGWCRGSNFVWKDTGKLWLCFRLHMPITDCRDVCNWNPECYAFDFPTGSEFGNCCIFQFGNHADSSLGLNRTCYEKPQTEGQEFQCAEGQGQYDRGVVRPNALTKTACETYCHLDIRCMGYDFSNVPLQTSCRTYGPNLPRYGPSSKWQYCAKISGPRDRTSMNE